MAYAIVISMTKREKAIEIYKRLKTAIPNPRVELQYSTPFELLVATILSAQCTDALVNTVTPALFSRFKTIRDYANASVEDIDRMIQKINFHSTKAKNIHGAANMIMDHYGGDVPKTMEALDALPGVARKTANVILGSYFGIAEGIVIDTHGIRLANKLGLTQETDPVKIERDLMALLPKETWIEFGNLLTLHGRYTCTAKPHSCANCPLDDLCPEYAQWHGLR